MKKTVGFGDFRLCLSQQGYGRFPQTPLYLATVSEIERLVRSDGPERIQRQGRRAQTGQET